MVTRLFVHVALACLFVSARSSSAEAPKVAPAKEAQPTEPEAPARAPALHHAPVSTGVAHEALRLTAEIADAHRVRRAIVVYRTEAAGEFQAIDFQRGDPGPYVAEIPATVMLSPAIEYAIELEEVDGRRTPVFASRARPQRVEVPEDLVDVRERAQSERLGHRRSTFSSGGDYVWFGKSPARVEDPATGLVETRRISDFYYRIHGAYTYRPFRTVAEFSIELGVVRGRAPVPDITDEDQFDVGLNYGAPSLRLRLADPVHLEGRFLTSVTEVGFAVGAGGAILVGDPYGAKLVMGGEVIDGFGARIFSRMDLVATGSVTVSPIVEVSDMPHADEFGVRLAAELGVEAGAGFGFALRGGYQARESTSGGPSGGATVSYSF